MQLLHALNLVTSSVKSRLLFRIRPPKKVILLIASANRCELPPEPWQPPPLRTDQPARIIRILDKLGKDAEISRLDREFVDFEEDLR